MCERIGEVRETIRELRVQSLKNAHQQVNTAALLYNEGKYASACFLAMTAIEEAGKSPVLQFVDITTIPSQEAGIDSDSLQAFLRQHSEKSLRAAGYALCVNNSAARRHGKHPDADILLKYGVLALARSGSQWMRIRGNCLYTDCNLPGKSVTFPKDAIDPHYAYYFTCMAYEVVAENAEAGFGSFLDGQDVERSHQFWQSVLEELTEFMQDHSDQFDASELDFFTDPALAPQLLDIKQELDLDDDVQREIREDVAKKAEEKGEDPEFVEELRTSDSDDMISSVCIEELEKITDIVNNIVVNPD